MLIFIEILDLIKDERKPPAQDGHQSQRRRQIAQARRQIPPARHLEEISGEGAAATTTTLSREKTDTNGPSIFGGQDLATTATY